MPQVFSGDQCVQDLLHSVLKMKSSPLLVCLIAVLGLSCAEKKQEAGKKEAEAVEPTKEATNSIVSLRQLLEKKEQFKDQPVTIAAYFVTHFEGPWICAENGDSSMRLKTTLSLKNFDFQKIRLNKANRERIQAKFFSDQEGDTKEKDLSDEVIRSLVRHEFPDGVPALITGTFRIGDYEYLSGFKLKDHPYIEVKEIQIVEADDPRWGIARENPPLLSAPKKIETNDLEGD